MWKQIKWENRFFLYQKMFKVDSNKEKNEKGNVIDNQLEKLTQFLFAYSSKVKLRMFSGIFVTIKCLETTKKTNVLWPTFGNRLNNG